MLRYKKKDNPNNDSGYIVQTKLGRGVTKDADTPIKGKVPVYLDDGRKVLCSIDNIKTIGLYD